MGIKNAVVMHHRGAPLVPDVQRPVEQSVCRTIVVKVGVAAFGGNETLIRILSNNQN